MPPTKSKIVQASSICHLTLAKSSASEPDTDSDISGEAELVSFPDSFAFGVATAAFQIEGSVAMGEPCYRAKIRKPLEMSNKCLMVTFRVLQTKCQKNVPEGTHNVKHMS